MPATKQQRTEFLRDILIGAVEGGIGYWSRVTNYTPNAELGQPVVTVWPLDSGSAHTCGDETVRDGLRRVRDETMNSELKQLITDADKASDAGQLDAEACDVILQVGMFGQIIYG